MILRDINVFLAPNKNPYILIIHAVAAKMELGITQRRRNVWNAPPVLNLNRKRATSVPKLNVPLNFTLMESTAFHVLPLPTTIGITSLKIVYNAMSISTMTLIYKNVFLAQ